jgi:tetratricopeptide (TPR) repeat protein
MTPCRLVCVALLLSGATAVTQQPETLSMMGKPLFAPRVSGEDRARLEASIADARATLARDPKNADAWLLLARSTGQLGHVGEALEISTRAIELLPEEARLFRERGHDFVRIRKFEVALRDFKKAAETIPDAHCDEGFALYLLARFPEAHGALKPCPSSRWLYLSGRRSGQEAAKNIADTDEMAKSYVTAVEALIKGDKDKATDLLKGIVEKKGADWRDDTYIAAEADYARLPHRKAKPPSKKKKGAT